MFYRFFVDKYFLLFMLVYFSQCIHHPVNLFHRDTDAKIPVQHFGR